VVPKATAPATGLKVGVGQAAANTAFVATKKLLTITTTATNTFKPPLIEDFVILFISNNPDVLIFN
jgi:hypothetical protein